jgi:adenylate cyclase
MARRRWSERVFGAAGAEAPMAALPERVQSAIRREQDRSEILIGWIELAVVVVFGALYGLSRKTFAADVQFVPVPWALGAYTGFILLRLAIAYTRRLPGWFVVCSAAIDIALLYGLMWSFHLEYRQPASFVLKAPTLLYIFIFIALRALRFEARYVIITGAIAAAGWLGLVLRVITDVDDNPMITRDYVTYLTSNSVLLGAEFDKVISIIVVTAILAVALARARKLLVRSLVESAAVRELSRFFAPEVAEQITRSEQEVTAGRGMVRDAAIVNVDVRGFTRLSGEMPADELLALLRDYQARIVPLIREHGGAIDKFLGDGIMATFGAVLPSARYAADALRAIDAVMAAAEAWGRERRAIGKKALRVCAAVATGRVVFGAVGDGSRLEYTVIGDAVNLAAKLEKHTKREQVRALATREAFEAALAQGYVPAGPRPARPDCAILGVDEPRDLVVLAA